MSSEKMNRSAKFANIVNNCRQKSNDLKLRRCNPSQKILTDEFNTYYTDSSNTFTDFNRKPFTPELGLEYENKMNYYQTQCNSYYPKFKKIIDSDCKNRLTVKSMLIIAFILIAITFLVLGFFLKNKTLKIVLITLGSLILAVLGIVIIYNLFFGKKYNVIEQSDIPFF